MEVLSDILKGLHATGSVYFCDFLPPPWELSYTDESRAMFHLVRRGRCQLKIAGGTLCLETGDFVFIAPQNDHQVTSVSDGDPQTLLLCGYCSFDAVDNDALLGAIPDHVLLNHDELAQWPWLTRTLEHLSAEYMSGAPGSDLTVNKLTEVLLVQLLRADFGRTGDVGIVAALADKRIARAMAEMHERPAEHWTIENAAAVAAMSRSGFARRFKELLGVSFFDYLTRLRMRNARDLLTTSAQPVAIIAEKVGYQNDLSFVKVFKKIHGKTPRAYRQNATD